MTLAQTPPIRRTRQAIIWAGLRLAARLRQTALREAGLDHIRRSIGTHIRRSVDLRVDGDACINVDLGGIRRRLVNAVLRGAADRHQDANHTQPHHSMVNRRATGRKGEQAFR